MPEYGQISFAVCRSGVFVVAEYVPVVPNAMKKLLSGGLSVADYVAYLELSPIAQFWNIIQSSMSIFCNYALRCINLKEMI